MTETVEFVQGDIIRLRRTGDRGIFVRRDGRWARIRWLGDPDDTPLAALPLTMIELVYRSPEVAADAR